jgi:hypothetical protein
MPNESYDKVKLEQIKSESVTRIYGRPLDGGDQFDLAARSKDDSHFALQWCLCVQDSPESPCLCRPLIVWIGRTDVITWGEQGRKDHAGESLYFFDLRNDSELLLERIQPISTTVARRLASLPRGDFDKLLAASTTFAGIPFGVAFDLEPDPANPFGRILAILADTVGKAIDWQQFVKDYGKLSKTKLKKYNPVAAAKELRKLLSGL